MSKETVEIVRGLRERAAYRCKVAIFANPPLQPEETLEWQAAALIESLSAETKAVPPDAAVLPRNAAILDTGSSAAAPSDGTQTSGQAGTAPEAPALEPDYDSFGYALAMAVLQSPTYARLDDKERAECDELIARGQGRRPRPALPPREPSEAQVADAARMGGRGRETSREITKET